MNDPRIQIVKKAALVPHQLDMLDEATASARAEPGPSSAWDDPICHDMLRAIVLKSTAIPVGLLHIGGPSWAVDVGWWIRPDCRGLGFCSEALDLLAETLREEGATGLAKILILDVEHARSRHLLDRFVKRFAAGAT